MKYHQTVIKSRSELKVTGSLSKNSKVTSILDKIPKTKDAILINQNWLMGNPWKGFWLQNSENIWLEEGQSVRKNSHGLIEPLICEAKGQFDGKQVNVIKKSKSDFDEKKLHLKELDKLMLDSDDADKGKGEPKSNPPTIFQPLKPYRLGSFSGPIVWC